MRNRRWVDRGSYDVLQSCEYDEWRWIAKLAFDEYGDWFCVWNVPGMHSDLLVVDSKEQAMKQIQQAYTNHLQDEIRRGEQLLRMWSE